MLLGATAAAGIVALVAFVLPNWTDYRFYNWQMSVTRKPSYGLRSLVDRVHVVPGAARHFTRMWFAVRRRAAPRRSAR